MLVHDVLKEETDELMACCGQLLASDRDQEHSLCDGKEDPYRIGGLAIEMGGVPSQRLSGSILLFPHVKPPAPGFYSQGNFGLCVCCLPGNIHIGRGPHSAHHTWT